MFGNILSQNGANGKQSVPPSKVETVAVSIFHDSDKTSFAKHLRWKLKSRDVEWMDISPEMAALMLEYNAIDGLANRPQSTATVEKYARLIKCRMWGVEGAGTCEPIIFSDKFRLLSGQHRLSAIVVAGVAQRMLVVFGEPDGNFAFIDQGRRRTASDIFAVNGVPNHAMAAASVRWLVAYERGTNGGDDATGNLELSNQEAYDAYLAMPNLQESMKIGQRFGADRLPHPAKAAAVHYLCAQKSRRAADEYFRKVASGVGFESSRDPAKKVRDFFTRADFRVSARQTAAALIQGWNAIRTNKQLTKVDPDASVGRIV
jgi:hypothetical protein